MMCRRWILLGCSMGLSACSSGDNFNECTTVKRIDVATEGLSPCLLARDLLTESSSTLLVSQVALDRYRTRLERALAAEPALAKVNSRVDWTMFADQLATKEPALSAAWQIGNLSNDNSELAAALQKVDARLLQFDGETAPMSWRIRIDYPRLFSPRLLDAELQKYGVEFVKDTYTPAVPAVQFRWPDGAPSDGADDATVEIDAWILMETTGFGPAGPRGPSRKLRAVVSSTMATVYDLGGDPFPNGVSILSSETKPWP